MLLLTSKNARALQREEKGYQTLIENKGGMLLIYLCFTLSINIKSYNLSYDDHMAIAVRLASAEWRVSLV
jgi:hypothetical protein